MEQRRDKLNIPDDMPAGEEESFSLEEILAEYGGKWETPAQVAQGPAADVSSAAKQNPAGSQKPERKAAPTPEAAPAISKQPPREEKPAETSPATEAEPDGGAREEEELRLPEITPEGAEGDGVAESVYAGLRRLLRDADQYAGRMYEAGFEEADAAEEAEAEEEVFAEENWWPFRRRKAQAEPEIPPEEMAREYQKGLKSLRIRSGFALFCCAVLCYMSFGEHFSLPLPAILAQGNALFLQVMLGFHLAVILLGADVVGTGIRQFCTARIEMEALVALSCLVCLADGVSALFGYRRGDILPFCAVSAAALYITMCATRQKRLALRLACKCAASSAVCYLVTGDPEKWSGQKAFTKHAGALSGFTEALRAPDCAQRVFQKLAPLLILAALLFAVLSSVGRERPEYWLWNLSAILAASASFSGLLCFSQPFLALSKRLFHAGAALCGWPGIAATARARNIVLTDGDLFPAGSAALNGIKIFGDFPVDKVVSCTASLIRASGSGLDKIFHDLLRNQGAIYRRVDNISYSDSGGMEAVVRGERVLCGSAAFMDRMGIPLTQGLHVKNAVFTAIGGELAGIFAVSYTAQPNIRAAFYALTRSSLRPVLATRNFSVNPVMLGQRFKLPPQKMDYPAAERRRELSAEGQSYGETVTAVICRDGLPPYAEAVLGAARLRRAARFSAFIAAVGSAAGSLLSFYLAFSGAFLSLTPANLFVFMMLWMVPTLLISGWVTRY